MSNKLHAIIYVILKPQIKFTLSLIILSYLSWAGQSITQDSDSSSVIGCCVVYIMCALYHTLTFNPKVDSSGSAQLSGPPSACVLPWLAGLASAAWCWWWHCTNCTTSARLSRNTPLCLHQWRSCCLHQPS